MNHKVSRIRQLNFSRRDSHPASGEAEVTLKICSYAESGLRRFARMEGRNLNHEVVRVGLPWWHQQYPRTETTRDGTATGGQRRFAVSIKGLSTPTLLDSEIPANATLLSVSRKSPVNPIAALSLDNVSDPLTLANATWLSVSRKSPVNPHSRPLPGQRER